MKNKYRIISMVLTIAMVFTLLPSYADAKYLDEENALNNRILLSSKKEVDKEGNVVKAIAELKEATYTYEVTDENIYSIGVYNNGMIDIAVKKRSTDEIFTTIITLEQLLRFKEERKNIDTYDLVKKCVVNNDIKLNPVNTDISFKFDSTRASTSNYKDRIKQELYDAGWPEPYQDYVRETKVKNGAFGELRHSVSYVIKEKNVVMVAAGVSLSVIFLYYTWPVSIWAQIASVGITGAGVYKSLKNFYAADYDVYFYGDKWIYVNDQYQYSAGRTRKWKAAVGDIGVKLDKSYDHYDGEYFNHDALFTTGFNNYFNN